MTGRNGSKPAIDDVSRQINSTDATHRGDLLQNGLYVRPRLVKTCTSEQTLLSSKGRHQRFAVVEQIIRMSAKAGNVVFEERNVTVVPAWYVPVEVALSCGYGAREGTTLRHVEAEE